MVHVRHVLLSVLSCVLLFANVAAAQDCHQVDTQEDDDVAASAESRLTQLEKSASVVLEQGAMSDKDGATVDELTNACAGDMMKAYQIMSNASERAASSDGKDGDSRLSRTAPPRPSTPGTPSSLAGTARASASGTRQVHGPRLEFAA